AGVPVARIVDTRPENGSALAEAARNAGIEIANASGIVNVETSGPGFIEAVKVARYSGLGRVGGREQRIPCDFVCVSGGWNPTLHLYSHTSGKLIFDETIQAFRPGHTDDPIVCVGAANGTFALGNILEEAHVAGEAAARAALGGKTKRARKQLPRAFGESEAPLEPAWFVPATGTLNEGNKHFIDLQNDVTAADLELAAREGYRSVEHVKRYTTLGMGTDQGRTGNINALGVLTGTLERDIPAIGTTTFRPPYTPVAFGAIAGNRSGNLFLPVRRTPPWAWHVRNDAD